MENREREKEEVYCYANRYVICENEARNRFINISTNNSMKLNHTAQI